MAEVEEALGPVEGLVNNAGLRRESLLALTSDADWDAVLDANLGGLFRCCRAVLRGMMVRRRGAIVNVSSLSALHGVAGQAAYAASKAGILGLTRSLAREVGKRGVRVNAVVPGFVPTDLTAGLPEAAVAALRAGECLPGGVQAADVAEAVALPALRPRRRDHRPGPGGRRRGLGLTARPASPQPASVPPRVRHRPPSADRPGLHDPPDPGGPGARLALPGGHRPLGPAARRRSGGRGLPPVPAHLRRLREGVRDRAVAEKRLEDPAPLIDAAEQLARRCWRESPEVAEARSGLTAEDERFFLTYVAPRMPLLRARRGMAGGPRPPAGARRPSATAWREMRQALRSPAGLGARRRSSPPIPWASPRACWTPPPRPCPSIR